MDTAQKTETFGPNENVERNVNEMLPMVDAKNLANSILEDAEAAFRFVGHIEAAEFMLAVSEKMIAETAIKIKKDKLFKHFVITDGTGIRRHVSNFEEFCIFKLKKSRQRIEELVRNYNLLGPELYEKAEKIGFGQRDYNALRALPEDDRKIITLAMEEENFNKALDLMSMMAAKHEAEKTAAKKQQEELKATLAAKDDVISQKTDELNKKSEQLAKYERKALTATPEDKALNARNIMQRCTEHIRVSIMTELRAALIGLEDAPGEHNQLAASCILEISRELNILRDEYALPHVVSDEILQNPTWQAVLKELDETDAGSEG